MMLEGFILGLSSGVACIATCAPVLIPYLLGEGKGIVHNCWVTGQFLLGRLVGLSVVCRFGLDGQQHHSSGRKPAQSGSSVWLTFCFPDF